MSFLEKVDKLVEELERIAEDLNKPNSRTMTSLYNHWKINKPDLYSKIESAADYEVFLNQLYTVKFHDALTSSMRNGGHILSFKRTLVSLIELTFTDPRYGPLSKIIGDKLTWK